MCTAMTFFGIATSLFLVNLPVAAQVMQSPACSGTAHAFVWPPRGPDRGLSEDKLRIGFLNPRIVTRMVITGGVSGQKLFADFHPDGKLAGDPIDGGNFGREWKRDGNKLCRVYYQFNRGQFDCGHFEIKNGKLHTLGGDGVQSVVDTVEFQGP